MSAVVIRILLRYLAMWLVAKGYMSDEAGNMFSTDPDIAAMIDVGLGAALGVAAEAWHYVARRLGWTT